ncbi:helix-turn-helix domain-containing protein [Treponema sp.]|uniref:helix-turn-helix domain-containing protein n=1 Tax=Treponema sp. TaxID=166 RepID=UPI003EFE47C3
MDDIKKDFIANLIFYRTQKNMSQLELSGICDCAKSTISGIESRKNFPSFELILKIAYALEIHPADLFLRNASKTREDVRDFFEKELSVTIKEMVEKKFPAAQKDEE